jgi:hypothetical protein
VEERGQFLRVFARYGAAILLKFADVALRQPQSIRHRLLRHSRPEPQGAEHFPAALNFRHRLDWRPVLISASDIATQADDKLGHQGQAASRDHNMGMDSLWCIHGGLFIA